ncbi:MAG TPA: DUF1579 family protein [Flavisolibacter sp.]|nr:DUF1579 family protein [Flavisolibacter sp.]
MSIQDSNQKGTQQDELKIQELSKLEVFIGKWHAEGTSYAGGQDQNDPYASAAPWTSEESYEWLPGNFFVLHKWNAKAGDTVFIGTEIIGYDKSEKKFFTNFFDNAGFHPVYQATFEDNIWYFSEPNTKAQVTINDKDTITFNWEWRNEGSDWLPLCDRVARRVE